jgi:hypothetical protein
MFHGNRAWQSRLCKPLQSRSSRSREAQSLPGEDEIARQRDPQIAAIYYDQMVNKGKDQMVNKGKHHTQAVCACATHLLDRVRVILAEDRAYELRDVNGTPITRQQARAIVLERYTVQKEVRERNNRRARRQRAE